MNKAFMKLMRTAMRLTRAAQVKEATAVIKLAIANAGRGTTPDQTDAGSHTPVLEAAGIPILKAAPKPTAASDIIDVEKNDVNRSMGQSVLEADPADNDAPIAQADLASVSKTAVSLHQAKFSAGIFRFGAKAYRYKFYAPTISSNTPLPLIVMLHGCTQDPDDFAAGTGMNVLAEMNGFFVLYPAQSSNANPTLCWNWFKSTDQHRGRGEPALIAAITLAMMQAHNIDSNRVYIAGLSAGGAMAAIVAEVYPEIFAAVGVHSGLPRGAASNVIDALTVMKRGASAKPTISLQGAYSQAPVITPVSMPTIVFHGGVDTTVHPVNGDQVILRAQQGFLNHATDTADRTNGSTAAEQEKSRQRKAYTRSIQLDQKGTVITEHWLVHDAGHAWSGGQAAGSYTYLDGPDASAEMVRFFFEHPKLANPIATASADYAGA